MIQYFGDGLPKVVRMWESLKSNYGGANLEMGGWTLDTLAPFNQGVNSIERPNTLQESVMSQTSSINAS